MKRLVLIPLLGAALGVGGCLPGDTRPEPARVFVTAAPGEATLAGIMTDDGWSIQFERLLAGLGNVTLRGDDCNEYAGAYYDRLLDFSAPGATKLGEAYGLGTCDVQFRFRWPSSEAILGAGVSNADLLQMREPLAAVSITEPLPGMDGPVLRATVYVQGKATRAGKTKHFAWHLSGRSILGECAGSDGEQLISTFSLVGGAEHRPAITIHGEELFHISPKPGAPLVFDWLADADANADGEISMDELAAAPAPMVEMGPGMMDAGMMDAGALSLPGLLGFLSDQRLPQMPHLDGMRCVVIEERFGR